jgi:putative MATE family efflux protein
MKIELSDHFTYKKLFRFTFPSIVMMIFTSIYGVVDGLFVSHFAGKAEFTAVNFIMPFLMILGAFGFVFGAGGSALIAKTAGEGDKKRANGLFSLIVYTSIIIGVVIAVVGVLTVRPVAELLGAEGVLLDNCVLYGRIILLAMPAFMLQMEFQTFFITAERPTLGLYVTVASGVANMVLDLLLVGVFNLGLVGAALATAISQAIGGFVPLFYFFSKNTSLLRLGRPTLELRPLLQTCTNGSSELMSNISMSIVGMLYNVQLLAVAGEDGVAAYGVLMYVTMIFIAIFIGYSIGTAPIVSYHFGAANTDELKSIFKKSLVIIGACSVVMLALGELLARPLSQMFVGYDEGLFNMTVRGFYIYSFSFLFSGVAIWGSGFFTALNNGLVSAIISFLRTLVFQIAAVLILPIFFELDGIWLSIVVAEVMATVVTAFFLIIKRGKYKY